MPIGVCSSSRAGSGDLAYTKHLADHYAMSDNYHQPAKGGTTFDSLMLEFGNVIWFADEDGNPAVPPHNKFVRAGTPNAGLVDEVKNPNLLPGTDNSYTEDGIALHEAGPNLA